MTQRIFDVENEKDMQDLWDILPDDITRIRDTSEVYSCKKAYYTYDSEETKDYYITTMLKINWHDKTEITRPIQEATEQDVGKLCMFSYPQEDVSKVIGILRKIKKTTDGKNCYKMYGSRLWYIKCRRLNKTEIEELC